MRLVRRLRLPILLLTLMSALLLPTPRASATHESVEVVVQGNTTNSGIPVPGRINHCGSFSGVEIEVTARTAAGDAQARISQTGGHTVGFCVDEDLQDGTGTISALDTSREFEGTGIEIRADGVVDDACVRARIDSGTFIRVGTVVDVELEADIRVRRDPNGDGDCADGVDKFHIEGRLCLALTAVPDSLSTFEVTGTGKDCPHT